MHLDHFRPDQLICYSAPLALITPQCVYAVHVVLSLPL